MFIGGLPHYEVNPGGRVADLAVADMIPMGEGSVDLIIGIHGLTSSRFVVAAFETNTWESCQVDADDIDTIEPADAYSILRGLSFADINLTSSTAMASLISSTFPPS